MKYKLTHADGTTEIVELCRIRRELYMASSDYESQPHSSHNLANVRVSKTGQRNIYPHGNKFVVKVYFDGRQTLCGYEPTLERAIKLRDRALIVMSQGRHPGFAQQNIAQEETHPFEA